MLGPVALAGAAAFYCAEPGPDEEGMAMRADRLHWIGLMAVATLGGAAIAGAGEEASAKGGVEAKVAFARLKKMAGNWEADIEATGKAADFKKKVEQKKAGHHAHQEVIFKLTGAGSALIETQMPGPPARDGLGVSPRRRRAADDPLLHRREPAAVQARPGAIRPDHLVFAFDGGSNLDPDNDIHIHGLEITFHEDGRSHRAWDGYLGGKPFGTTSFVMTRSR